ncbi:MAG: aminotransferase class V-fold PLP-dependent enzyme [Candidatus Melainabacteria bacterium]|nr:aminotransferase class V-fold PLP-dependent enzyme [Candidatus Melainabacteria bacterium]
MTTNSLAVKETEGIVCDISAAIPEVTIDVAAIRAQFPIIQQKPDYVFFDNASTTQKPATVIRAIEEYYAKACSNAGRASYRLSSKTALAIHNSRAKVAELINCRSEDLVFTSGATDSLNTVALSWGLTNLNDGDEVMVCLQDHKSAVLPWFNVRRILAGFGKNIKIVPFEIHDVGDYDLRTIRENVSTKTRLIAMSHIHHVYGMDMEVPDIREIVGPDVLISLDASQSVGHISVNVEELAVDFISFSGHKMFAGNGTGILWVNPKRQPELSPVRVGGMGATFAIEDETTFFAGSLQDLLEAGTPNIPSIVSLAPAVEFIQSTGIENISGHLAKLTRRLYEGLKEIPGVDFGPGPGRCGCPGGYGILSFRIEGIEVSDLGFMLDSENIMVRTGDHCVSKASSEDEYARVSLQVYNTEEEIEMFIEVLEDSIS